jgi:hypothetical protein
MAKTKRIGSAGPVMQRYLCLIFVAICIIKNTVKQAPVCFFQSPAGSGIRICTRLHPITKSACANHILQQTRMQQHPFCRQTASMQIMSVCLTLSVIA